MLYKNLYTNKSAAFVQKNSCNGVKCKCKKAFIAGTGSKVNVYVLKVNPCQVICMAITSLFKPEKCVARIGFRRWQLLVVLRISICRSRPWKLECTSQEKRLHTGKGKPSVVLHWRRGCFQSADTIFKVISFRNSTHRWLYQRWYIFNTAWVKRKYNKHCALMALSDQQPVKSYKHEECNSYKMTGEVVLNKKVN